MLVLATMPAGVRELRAQLSPRDFTTLAALDCSIQRAPLAEARAVLSAADKTVGVNTRLLELQTIGKLEGEVAQPGQALLDVLDD